MFALSCTSPCTKWNRLRKDKCSNKFTKSCIQPNKVDMEALRNIDVPLVPSMLTLIKFHTFSFAEFGGMFQAAFSTEIKVQKSKNYETCNHRYKLCHINHASQSAIWKETRIKFKKYSECSFWTNMYKFFWDFCSIGITSL